MEEIKLQEPQSPVPGMTQEEYAAGVRYTAEKTKQLNLKEIGYLNQMLERLTAPDFDNCELPAQVHNFILLCPKDRFDLIPIMKDLLRMDLWNTPFSDRVHRSQIKDVLDEIEHNIEVDIEVDHALFDISQFLTSHFCAITQIGIKENHTMRKKYKAIYEHILNKVRAAIYEKKQTVRSCDDILSRRLLGEKEAETYRGYRGAR